MIGKGQAQLGATCVSSSSYEENYIIINYHYALMFKKVGTEEAFAWFQENSLT